MKLFFYISLFFLLPHQLVVGQNNSDKYVDFGFYIGGSYYIGDLNKKHFDQFTKPAGGAVFRYNFNQRAALRANFLMGTVEAHDSESSSEWQKQRNLNFRSSIKELSVQFEFNYLNYKIGGNELQNFAPYVFIGIAGFHFSPEGQISNDWTNLQSLGTEGQGLPGGPSNKKYKLTQISVPLGLGFKTGFSKGMCIGFEWGARKTFTDYLDDVSSRYYSSSLLKENRGDLAVIMADRSINTNKKYSNAGKLRGDASNKDWYVFFGVVLTLKLIKTQGCQGAMQMGGS